MFVIKRDGSTEPMSFDKITARNEKFCFNFENSPNLDIDPISLSKKVIESIYSGISTREIDNLSCETALYMSTYHPDFEILAKRIAVSNLHKSTHASFYDLTMELHSLGLLKNDYVSFVENNKDVLESFIDYSKDYSYTYFGLKTLEKSYLNKNKRGDIVERPQHLNLRIAIFLRMDDGLSSIKEIYDLLADKYFTHASPTMFNAGMKYSQLSSCFLLSMNDQLEDMMECMKSAALISKFSGGIGINISMIRPKGSRINSTGGHSDGIIPFLKVWNSLARYVNQCLHPDTKIYTPDGIKRIIDMKKGDFVFTSDGTIKQVNEVFSKSYDGYLTTLKLNEIATEVRATPEHQLLTLTKFERQEGKSPVYKLVGDLKVGDFVFFPKNLENIESTPKPTDDFYKFLGLLVSQGFVLEEGMETSYYVYTEYARDFIKDYIAFPYKNQGKFISFPLGFINGEFQDTSPETFSLTNEIINLPIHQLRKFHNGLFLNTYSFITKSKILLHQIILIHLRLGILPHVKELQERGKKLYKILIDENNTQTLDGFLYTEISGISNELHIGNVYDLNIEENHNYLTEIGIVHNSGRRKGAVAVYLEPHHPDIVDFLKIRKNNTKEEHSCLDLHMGLWVSDIFMKRVENDEIWSLFDPSVVKLHEIYGEEYEKVYIEKEKEGLFMKQISARELFKEIMMTQIETGEPYILFKDTINRRSNQKNIGVIRGSNLCTEITEYTDNDTIAVCNLASISLPAFVKDGVFNYTLLGYITEKITENMNYVIDKNFYPDKKAEKSNFSTRPIGIGVQGLADVFQMMELSWDDELAKEINDKVFAVIYYHSLKKSCEIAKEKGWYERFPESPFSMGLLQFDLAGKTAESFIDESLILDWEGLKEDIKKYGVRNSLLTTQMPTASTSQILGNNESTEPYTSNLYVRRVLAGDFPVINKHLYEILKEKGMWNKQIIDEIIKNDGSIQTVGGIDDRTKEIFRTAWEMKTRRMIDLAVGRGIYIDQSQSFNVFMGTPQVNALYSMFLYEWKQGMKTGLYYLRTRSKVKALNFSLMENTVVKKDEKKVVCDEEVCFSCSA